MPHCPHCGHECSSRDLVQRDNSFREEGDDESQVTLDDLEPTEVTEGPDGTKRVTMEVEDQSVWERITEGRDEEVSIDFDPNRKPPEPGDVVNPQDPHKW